MRLDISGNLNKLEILNQFSKEDKKRLKVVFHDLKAEINSQISSEIGEPNIILHLAAAGHLIDQFCIQWNLYKIDVTGQLTY